MRLSAHFTLDEFIFSQTALRLGIDNNPGEEAHDNLHRLAFFMEGVREELGNNSIYITSGYRSPRLNQAVGGSSTSAHMSGLACDFICRRYGSPKTIATHVCDMDYDQLIQEGDWVHLAIAPPDKQPRRSLLTAHFKNGTVTYTEGL